MKNTTFKTSSLGKSLKNWYCCLLLCLSVSSAFAQGTIPIGSGTGTNTNIPIQSCMGYNYSQQIVKATEYSGGGGVAGNITKIRFYYGGGASSFANISNWDIYLGHTTKTEFTSNTDWEPVANLTQVFSGVIPTPLANNWFEITLTTPFNYNGTSNLIVAVDENLVSWNCTANWGSYSSTANTGIYYNSDGTNPNPASPPSATGRTGTLARLQFEGILDTCVPPTGIATGAVGASTATINWQPSATPPSAGYDYYYSTSATAPTDATSPLGSTAAGVTTVNLTGLSSLTPYYFWVRSNCGAGDISSWAAFTFTTACGIYMPSSTIETFTSYTGSMPNPACWSEATGTLGATPAALTGTSSTWSNLNFASNGPAHPNGNSVYMNLYGTDNEWFVSPAFDLGDGSVDYQLEYSTIVTPWTGMATVTDMGEKAVRVVVSTDGGATWSDANVLETYNNANIPATTTNEVILLDGYTGVVKIGFYGSSTTTSTDLRFYVDNFRIRAVPSCIAPTALTFEEAGETTATISWTASASLPAEGYEYYRSTTNTAPIEATAATGSVGAGVLEADLTGMTVSTTYYVWLRAECEPGLYSEWIGPISFTTLCDGGDILTSTGDSICGEGTADLSVTGSAGAVFKWYAAETGGAAMSTGASFETPYIYETTPFYVSAGNIAANTNVNVGNGASTSSSGGYSPFYHGWGGVKTQFIVTAAELQAAGISAGPINSVGFTVTGLGAPSYESFALSIGTTTQSVATNTHVDGLTQVYANASQTLTVGLNVFTFTTPFAWDGTSNIVVSTCYHNPATPFGGSSATVEYDVTPYVASTYTYADNQSAAAVCAATTGGVGGSGGTATASARAKMTFNATALCESPRVMVTATVTDAPDIELASEDAEICVGGSTELSVESANAAYTYMWMPGNLAGATQTVSPEVTTTYTIIATDEVGGCVESGEITVTVNELPDPVSITPVDADVCFNDVVELNGSMPEMAEYCTPTVVEDGATGDYINNFTFANITNNGSGDAASDYTYYSAMTANVVAGQSYPVTVQGGSATWAQGFRVWIDFNQDGIFSEDESVFNTATAATTQFTGNITIPANAINGTTRMRVGDRYNSVIAATASCSHNGFGEYEDYNVSITGGLEALQYAWTPEEGLFLDEAATMPYTGESVNTVYAFITEDVTYTYTATNGNGCEISSETDITVIITPAPAAAAAQSFCSGATVADLTTTDAEAVTHWYYSAVGGNELAGTTPLLNGTPYFVSQTLNGCEGVARTMVTATVITTPAPEASDDVQTFCNAATLADVEVDGENVMWYAAATGGEALASDMALEEGISLYFASQTVDGCESPMRTAVAVELNITDAPMVADDAPIFCNSATIADIMVEGDNVMWYDAAEGGNMLPADTALMDGGMYYASQTVNGCESAERTMVDVSINAPEAPTGDDTQEFCFVGTVGDLVAEGAAMWYDASEGGNMLSADTALVDGMMYYASQVVDGCESITRFGVTATIIVVEADAPENVFACYEYTLPELNNGNYYTDSNGAGEMLAAGTVITETITLYVYYVGASELGCSDENTFMVVIGNAAAPTGDDTQEFSVEAGEEVTIADIEVATEGIGTITWYASAEDAAAGENALSADTVLADGMTYYATWTIGDCTSEEALAVTIDVVLGRDGFDKGAFTYYPNPVQDVLNMSYTSEISSVEVFNMLGQKVMSVQPNTTEVKLNMASLSDATYIVNVTSGDSVQTIKVVKKQ